MTRVDGERMTSHSRWEPVFRRDLAPASDGAVIVDDNRWPGLTMKRARNVEPGILSDHDVIAQFDAARHRPFQIDRRMDGESSTCRCKWERPAHPQAVDLCQRSWDQFQWITVIEGRFEILWRHGIAFSGAARV